MEFLDKLLQLHILNLHMLLTMLHFRKVLIMKVASSFLKENVAKKKTLGENKLHL